MSELARIMAEFKALSALQLISVVGEYQRHDPWDWLGSQLHEVVDPDSLDMQELARALVLYRQVFEREHEEMEMIGDYCVCATKNNGSYRILPMDIPSQPTWFLLKYMGKLILPGSLIQDPDVPIIIIQGTATMEDVLVNSHFQSTALDTHYVHRGMLIDASIIASVVQTASLSQVNIIGFSLGAGIGAILTYLLSKTMKVRGLGFGTPAVCSLDLARDLTNFISVVLDWDLVPRLSVHSVDVAIQRLCLVQQGKDQLLTRQISKSLLKPTSLFCPGQIFLLRCFPPRTRGVLQLLGLFRQFKNLLVNTENLRRSKYQLVVAYRVDQHDIGELILRFAGLCDHLSYREVLNL
ncbi:Lipase class 3 family protein [Giardia muris]|uniref:Lipase class 3 family protein n=1 Tax=Giardia muris TaxID=5742 RepID=A0A4Z1T983_GIAMU|nr:Lipase class 3 family protein [Giardia muris]|eukprot:TNJ29707.1 Lipase class 3 family protein [Giardia muris]